jgi:hypothetical protein
MAEERLRHEGYEHRHTGVEVRSAVWYVKHLSQAHGVVLSEVDATGMSLDELTDLHTVKHESASGPARRPRSQYVHAVLHTVTLTVGPSEWALRPEAVTDIVEELAAMRGWVLRGEPEAEADEAQGLLLSWLATDHVGGAHGALDELRRKRLARKPRVTEDLKTELLTDPDSRGRSWAEEPDWRRNEDGTTTTADADQTAHTPAAVGGAGTGGAVAGSDLRGEGGQPGGQGQAEDRIQRSGGGGQHQAVADGV